MRARVQSACASLTSMILFPFNAGMLYRVGGKVLVVAVAAPVIACLVIFVPVIALGGLLGGAMSYPWFALFGMIPLALAIFIEAISYVFFERLVNLMAAGTVARVRVHIMRALLVSVLTALLF